MRFLQRLLQFLLIILILLTLTAFFLPGHAHVERTVQIARPVAEVFPVVNGFRLFQSWSPWTELDPAATYSIDGPAEGVGARIRWSGNQRVGSGSQTITASEPAAASPRVQSALDFGPQGQAIAEFFLTPGGSGTQVRWALDIDLPLALDRDFAYSVIGRYFGLVMDRMVGPDYERGLARLKALVETFPAADISDVHGEPIALASRKLLYTSVHTSHDLAAIATALGAAYARIGDYAKANGIVTTGAPLTITTRNDASGWDCDAAIAVDRNDGPGDADVKAASAEAGPALRFTSIGGYELLGGRVAKAQAWLLVHGYQSRDRLIEEYIDDPGTTPVENLRTLIVLPVK